jgi:hypothetical protein
VIRFLNTKFIGLKVIVILILSFISLSISGCDFLTTREAEKPDTGRSTFIAATTVEQLFKNLTESFREKIVRNYESCFVDSSFLNKNFEFYPATKAATKYNILTEWDLEAEKQYFANLITSVSKDKSIIVNLFNENSSRQGDSALYNYDYSIILPHTAGETLDHEYRGSTQFKVNLDANNHWVITEWIDLSTNDFPSWSELKGKFY